MPDRDDVEPELTAGGPDEAALAIVARHALHDEEVVVALAAGALDGEDEAAEQARARSLIERCPACRAVHDDVAALGTALRTEAAFTASAPRDFRLSVEDAHRLGGVVVLRQPRRSLGRLIAGFARPIGASMAALGLVGVFVGSAFLGVGGAAERQAGDAGSTTTGGALASAAPAAPSSLEIAAGPGPSPKSSDLGYSSPLSTRDQAAAAAPTWILVVSGAVIALGLALFVYGSMTARRGGSGSRAP